MKDIFDNVRNLGLSSLVVIMGFYVVNDMVKNAKNPYMAMPSGYALIGIGGILYVLGALHGLYMIRKAGMPGHFFWPLAALYVILVAPFFVSLVLSRGVSL